MKDLPKSVDEGARVDGESCALESSANALGFRTMGAPGLGTCTPNAWYTSLPLATNLRVNSLLKV